MSNFNINDKVLIKNRNDGLVYTVADKFKKGDEFLQEGQYLVRIVGGDGIVTHAFVVSGDQIILS